jgi:hypothetical protein
MIQKKLHIGGVELDLTLPQNEIEEKLNQQQVKCYLNLVSASYKEIDDRTVEITFHRNLPFKYAYGLGGQCLCYIDAAIVSGLTEDCFKVDFSGNTKPVCGPLIPWDDAWYIPTAAFTSFFRSFNETMVQEKISRVRIISDTDKLVVVVKYPRNNKGKYDDDIADLEAEIGEPLENRRGQTLTYTLDDLGQICQRSQVKTKSYQGLKSHLLKTYEITLNIK